MKRAAIFGMVIVGIATAWTYLAAQSSPSAHPQAIPEPIAPALPQSSKATLSPSERALTPLQQRYVDLAAKKARMMSEEQLQQAVSELDRDVDELNAWTKVEESARALLDVVEKHPRSRAAGAARSAIRIIEQSRSPNGPVPDERFSPRPDPGPRPAEQPFGAGAVGPKSPEPPST
jgi:hypothetical protein